MNLIRRLMLLILVLTAIPMGSAALAMNAEGNKHNAMTNGPYAFELKSQSDEAIQVKFVGNKMYNNGRYIGFGVSGKPMLSLRYVAERFGFLVAYESKSGTSLLSKGEYSFQLKPGSNMAEIFWSGNKVKEIKLSVKPLLRNNVLYLYSLDISELLGLITNWNNTTRTWDALYRDYTYKELGFPTIINDDLLIIKGILFVDGRYTMPMLQITGVTDKVRAYSSSIGLLESNMDSGHKYEMSSNVRLKKEEINRLQVSLTMGQRIIFAKKIEVAVNIEAKELVVNPPYKLLYQFSSPTKGYIRVTQPEILISGKVTGNITYYPPEVVVLVRKSANEEILLEKRIPIIDGQFKHELGLKNGEGLYKVTVNTIMGGPRGPVYPEITNFYVEYH